MRSSIGNTLRTSSVEEPLFAPIGEAAGASHRYGRACYVVGLVLAALAIAGGAVAIWPRSKPSQGGDTASAASAYAFTVCSASGGAHGVDFRSHFAVYTEQNGITGWVRNACDGCVYGMFSDVPGRPAGPAAELADILRNPSAITQQLASKANISRSVVTETHPDQCGMLPRPYKSRAGATVDWSYAKGCNDTCSCKPTAYYDCQQSTPVPTGAPYTNDCMRQPLGNTTKNFADCNSARRQPGTGTNCFQIDGGKIVSSDKCTRDYVNTTYAAVHCCGALTGVGKQATRWGLPFTDSRPNCTAYHGDASSATSYAQKCPQRPLHWIHPLD